MVPARVKRRDLKEDRVYTTMAGIAGFVSRHRFHIAVGVLIILGVFGIIYYRNVHGERAASEASLALYKAEASMDPAEKIIELEKIYKEYSGTPAAVTARYMRAGVLYQQGKYEEASQAFTEFYKRHPKDPAAPDAMEASGYSYESLGKWKEAADIYQALDKKFPATPAAKRAVSYRLGLCYEKLGETDKAIEAYKKTTELLPDSLWAEYAQERLSSFKKGPPGQAAPVVMEE